MKHCQKKRKHKTLIVFFQAGATTPRWAVEFWKPSADAFKKNNPDCTVRADYLQMLLRLVDKKKDLAQYFINLIFHCYRINLNDVFYPLYIKLMSIPCPRWLTKTAMVCLRKLRGGISAQACHGRVRWIFWTIFLDSRKTSQSQSFILETLFSYDFHFHTSRWTSWWAEGDVGGRSTDEEAGVQLQEGGWEGQVGLVWPFVTHFW